MMRKINNTKIILVINLSNNHIKKTTTRQLEKGKKDATYQMATKLSTTSGSKTEGKQTVIGENTNYLAYLPIGDIEDTVYLACLLVGDIEDTVNLACSPVGDIEVTIYLACFTLGDIEVTSLPDVFTCRRY